MQENNTPIDKYPVIVRAWGDEPVRLSLHRIENKRSYVGLVSARVPIGLPNEQVFAFDEEKFRALSTAFQHGDVRKLGQIWSEMVMDDYACNRYKVNLESQHDKEHITDTQGVATGSKR